jgi:hypothetical protein
MDENSPSSESVGAAMLLLLHDLIPEFEPLQRTQAEIVGITGADQAEASALRDKLMAALPQLMEEERTNPYAPALAPIQEAINRYFDEHPDSFDQVLRQEYSSEYRTLVLELLSSHSVSGIPSDRIASACCVSVATLRDWLLADMGRVSPPRPRRRDKPTGRRRRRR